ncbi:protein kinase C-binding protein NELL2a isoform X2 [Gouania willdenowi]|uniref:protein kinase C-binding protein NELL2a isoform X2 n=1 Tax=Gouania willdenowi TaxID=441366 RepID=UPI0010547FCC|nr:protein kinase C-binding protein NELL2 isoform X2 [Gouania willdenowi]
MGLLRCLLAFCVLCPASGFGVDPTLRISILDELMLPQSFDGVTQVQGFHGQSRAFLFQGSSRDVKAAAEVAKRMVQKLRGKNEFTVLVTLKQDYLNSGVIFSIHHSEHRFLELESSGQRNEVRLHYRTKGQQDHTEVFPYSLADNQWHKVSVAVSASHVILHVDCNRIYERVVEAPYMDIPGDTLFWLGQRNSAHGLFKDVEILVMPQGYISQCPDLNRTCPTCNDFHGLVQKIMELQDVLAKTSRKLSRAEEKMNALDGCYCERTCNISGVVYREDEGWTDGCMNCTCTNGSVHCETISCPPAQCPAGTTPTYVKGVCCKECQPVCLFGGREVVDGDMKAVRDSTGRCLLFECRDRTMHQIVSSEPCPELNCPEAEQITLSDRCCKICQGHDFCSEGHGCVEHSDCVNLEAGDCCVCKDGFRPLREDNAYCEDIDECAEGKHYCRENTMCVNTPGSFMCICLTGYIRIDDYSCTEHDVCLSGLHNCDENALCLNIVGGHSCSCKPGYMGNGTVCKALCDGLCQNGGTCASPNNCICQQGFTGKRCETDINECAEGFIECDSKSTCVNLPGWYHCECRDGYHDNGFFSANGESCVDINECKTGRNTCTNDTVCFNLEGSYDCRCPHGHNCTGDCIHDNKVKHSGQIWILDSDRCSVCSCQAGQVMCRRMVCDCNNPNADLYCCPECDPRLSSQCLHQNGLLTYSSGDTWVENCQQCQCLQGQVDCWPLSCPPGDCEFTVVPEGECCPRCVTDPCQADTIRNDITKTCSDEHNISRFSGSSWIKHGTECTLCQCKNGHICCSVDPMCL